MKNLAKYLISFLIYYMINFPAAFLYIFAHYCIFVSSVLLKIFPNMAILILSSFVTLNCYKFFASKLQNFSNQMQYPIKFCFFKLIFQFFI